ncbi:MAG: AbrB/MazE/SpoVT family DNA-binding domain-containing protein, partial [Nitrospirae bacterium]|nr:AbrB/MazE/SpoVT family DNA-binding domain-containing protein [Nitrospirota bacterium]
MLLQVQKRGLLTLPKAVRDQLRLEEGDVLEMETRGEEIILRPRAMRKLSSVRIEAGKLLKAAGSLGLGGDALKDTEAYE